MLPSSALINCFCRLLNRSQHFALCTDWPAINHTYYDANLGRWLSCAWNQLPAIVYAIIACDKLALTACHFQQLFCTVRTINCGVANSSRRRINQQISLIGSGWFNSHVLKFLHLLFFCFQDGVQCSSSIFVKVVHNGACLTFFFSRLCTMFLA